MDYDLFDQNSVETVRQYKVHGRILFKALQMKYDNIWMGIERRIDGAGLSYILI